MVGTLSFALRILVAFDGGNWQQARLQRKGYILSDIAAGDSELAAKQRFYTRWLQQEAA